MEANVEVLEAESADDWEAVVSGFFVPLRCDGFEKTFRARMEHAIVDDRLSVSRVTECGLIAEHSGRLARRAETDDIHISLQLSSRGTVAQDGRAAAIVPGSVVLYATNRPYRLDYSWPDQRHLILQLSRASLDVPPRMLEAALARLAVPGGRRAVAAGNLFSFIETLSPGPSPEAAHVTRDLARTMIRASLGEGAAVPRTSGGLRHAVQEHLSAHAHDAGLDMDQVARRHLVSRRRLYQAFELSGQSPASYLRTQRLQIAARLLSDTAERRTVEQICYASGFDDPTTFTRAFRRAYGCTPREWRAQVR
ncbi:AraC family transcriptional regulator [Microbacterium sp. JZ31]|uniref:AraC family transcriptional regulator n=1 Tax=Microbacterium sp. JZ31 TaxID=1906274 RepID=UPI001EE47EC3|nr:AraC family transcriptional regulator [Microbacterium sp. JZ31]